MIEPPSVSDSSTACMAIVDSTLSISRLELTASLDLLQCLEGIDLLRQLRPAGLELLHERDAVDGHGRLSGEGRHDGHLPLVERADVVAPDRECADDLLVEDHRRAHGGPEPGHPLEVVAAVLRVGEHVGDLLGPPVQADPADQRLPVDWHRVLGDHLTDSSETPTDLISR